MKQEDVEKLFRDMQIDEKDYPAYDDPRSFAKQFKRCSILKYEHISYSNNTLNK